MAKSAPFSQHEAVLLLDAYLSTITGRQSKVQTVKKCSEDLRKMAVNRGTEIDDKYRTVGGIHFQMASMESAYVGKTIIKPATKLFTQTVELYRNNRSEYERILKEARLMVDGEKIEEEVPALSPSETDSLEDPMSLSDRLYQLLKKEKISSSKYLADQLGLINTVKVEKILNDVQWATRRYQRYYFNQDAVLGNQTFHFENPLSLAFTKPVSLTYFNNVILYVTSWRQLYVRFLKLIYKDYPHVLKDLCQEDSSPVFLTGQSGAAKMHTPVEFAEGLFAETNRCADDIMRYVRTILDACNVDTKNIVVVYEQRLEKPVPVKEKTSTSTKTKASGKIGETSDNAKKESVKSAEVSPEPPSTKSAEKKAGHSPSKTAFYIFLRARAQLPETACRSYTAAVTDAEMFAFRSRLAHQQLYSCPVEEAINTVNALFSNSDFLKYNQEQNNRFQLAITQFLDCIGSAGNAASKKVKAAPKPPSTVAQPVAKKPASKAAAPRLSPHAKKYGEILKTYFAENGYQPGRAISRGRFRRYYQELFGREIPEHDETWELTLERIGTERDGRIFPKQDETQNDLLNQILEDVVSTLKAGASGVSLESLFEKYSRQLADNLQIYNQDAMTDLLLDNAKHRFTKRYTYLISGRNNAEPLEDILRVCKNCHEPQTLDRLHEKLWYIPYDRMKFLIVTEPRLVSAGQSSYYYAPNLPVDAEEIQQMIRIIEGELESSGFLVGGRLVDLLYEKCPDFAMNTSTLPQLCVRNSLGYLLRDRFSFKGPVISARGSKLDLSDVYAAFAREREHFTLEELKDFSAELGVGIYWETIMGEVVRLSAREFVRRDRIRFDTAAIDAILDEQCHGDYMPLRDVSLYLSFPNIGYQWNAFVLSSYLYHSSKQFRFFYSSITQSDASGAMVRADSPIRDYYSLIVDALSRSDSWSSPKTALQYIVNCGFQQRLAYNAIDEAAKEAKLLKEKQTQNEK